MTDLSQYSDEELQAALAQQQPPLSVANNNPGNMKTPDGEFASYDSPKAGLASMQHDLTQKVAGNSPMMKSQYGDNYQPTLRNVITTWAPPSENDTDGYINFVSKHSGIDPDKTLTADDVPTIMQPMIHMEGGQKASSYFGKLMKGVGDAIIPEANASENTPGVSPGAQPVQDNAVQPSNVPNTNAPKVDLSQYTDEELQAALGNAAPAQESMAGKAWDIMQKGTEGAIKGGAQAESNIIAPFLSDEQKQKLREAGLYDVKHPEIANPFVRGVAESPLGATTAAYWGGLNAPVGEALNAGEDFAKKHGVSQEALDILNMGGTILGSAGIPNPTAKGSIFSGASNVSDAGADATGILANTSGKSFPEKLAPSPVKNFFSDETSGKPQPVPPPPSLLAPEKGAPMLVGKKAVPEAESTLGTMLNNDGINLADAKDKLVEAQKIDPNATLADVIAKDDNGNPAAPNTFGFMKSIAQSPGQGAKLFSNLIGRARSDKAPLAQHFDDALQGSNYYKTQGDAIQARDDSGKLFQQAFAENQNMMTPKINQILNRPAGQAALAKVAETKQNNGSLVGVSDPDLVEQAALTGQPPTGVGIASGLKMSTLHGVKKALYDMAESPSNYNQWGKRNESGSALMGMYHDLNNEMIANDTTGKYAQGLKAYSTPARVQEALENGRKFESQDPEEIQQRFNDPSIPDAEKKAYAQGAGKVLEKKFLKARNAGASIKNTVWNDYTQKQLQPMMTPESFDKLSNVMQLHDAKNAVNNLGGGSDTFTKFKYDEAQGTTKAGDAVRAVTDLPAFVGNKLGNIVDKALQKRVDKASVDAKAVAMRYLTTKDPELVQHLADQLGHTPTNSKLGFNLSAFNNEPSNNILGLKQLSEAASNGDAGAHETLNKIAHNQLNRLLSGIPDVKVNSSFNTGMYGGAKEPSLGGSIEFRPENRAEVITALAKTAKNFNQQSVHVLGDAEHPDMYHKYDDGSFNTPHYTIELKKPLSSQDVNDIVAKTGLDGVTFNKNHVETYYSGHPDDAAARTQFETAAGKLATSIGSNGRSVEQGISRLWNYSDQEKPGLSGQAESALRTPSPGFDPNARLVASRNVGRNVTGTEQAPALTANQTAFQKGIANTYDKLPDTDIKTNPNTARSYKELAGEVKQQYKSLPVKVEVWDKKGEPYKNSDAMRRDVQDNAHLYIYKTTPENFGPKGADFSGHPLLEDSGLKDSNGVPLLNNDLLRAVHDYYAHNLTASNFGPLGEEAAWKNHMASTKSPWARWALTTETRGQNSWVNFNKNVDPSSPLTARPFARQKAALMPMKYSMTGDAAVDAPMKVLQKQLGKSASGSVPDTGWHPSDVGGKNQK